MARVAESKAKAVALAVASQAPPFRATAQIDEWSPDLLQSKAYECILLDIILGALPPGARIDEQGLADHYKIGLAGVRVALGRLALEGMVQRQARRGTTVAPLDLEEVQQAFEARFLIEPHCAYLAAENASAAEIKAIQTAFDGAEKAVKARDFRKLIGMDQAFHKAVALASQNQTLAKIVISLHYKAARYWYYSMTTRPERSRLDDIEQHRTVAAAIAARQPKKAQAAMLLVLGDAPESVRGSVAGVRKGEAG